MAKRKLLEAEEIINILAECELKLNDKKAAEQVGKIIEAYQQGDFIIITNEASKHL